MSIIIKDIKDPAIMAKALQYAKESAELWSCNTTTEQLEKRQLNTAFRWSATNEGKDYWDTISISNPEPAI